MSNLPVRYMQQVPQQQRGPYIEITCASRSDHVLRIPFFPGHQEYCCPVCFGVTYVKIYVDGEVEIKGESTNKTDVVDRFRLIAMRFGQAPMMPLPNQSGSIEDLLNQL